MAGKWIAKAIRRPGTLKAKARRTGAITPRGTISKGWLRRKAKAGGRTGRQARLAMTLRKLGRK